MDFTYKGISTSTYGVILNSLEWYKKPTRRADQLSINGKDGATVVDNAYGALSLRCRITMTSTTNMSSVLAWLTGNGVLSFSEDSGKYRNAYVLDEVEFRRRGSIWEATFDFYCADPYRYVASEADTTLSGKTFTNMVMNGNFVGTTSWSASGGSSVLSAESNRLTCTGNGLSATPAVTQTQTYTSGRKYYARVRARVTNAVALSIRLNASGTIISQVTSPANLTWYNLSGVFTATSEASINIMQVYSNAATANLKALQVEYVSLLDLTSLFGAGNEPTKADMDTWYSVFTNNFFGGSTSAVYPNIYTNAGTMSALPLLKITGTGTVSVTLNSTMSVALDTAYVHIDSDLREVYYLTTLKNRLATGDFPYLSVGANSITVTGTVTEVVITPRTRYL